MQTLSVNVASGRNGVKSLYNLLRDRTKGGRGSTYLVEEIYQPIQLQSLKAGQILLLFITLNQDIEVAREIWGRGIKRIEVL